MHARRSSTFLSALLAAALLSGSAGTAYAADPPDSDIELLETVAPDSALNTAVTGVVDDALASQVDADNLASVEIPQSSAQDVVVEVPAESDLSAENMSRAPEDLEVSFSAEAATGHADIDDGIASFDNVDGHSRTLVQPTPEGVTYYSVMDSAAAPTRFAYTVTDSAGLLPELLDGGIAALVDAEGEPRFMTARPWARDANGRDLPTHFEWSGNTLVQYVDTSDPIVEYPVIADPAWSYSFSVRAYHQTGGGRYAVSSTQAMNELRRCFNCSFPVSGAPSRFPSLGQRLDLNASLWTAIPGPNAPVSVTQINGAGFGFKALSGHFDGAGSTIDFSFGGTRAGEQLLLSVRATVVRDRGSVANAANRAAAQAVWKTFVNKTSCNAIRYQQKRTC